jgi:hypothetical protein
MLDLLQTDPELALQLAVPFLWRQQLPPNITRYFEQTVDTRGTYLVAEANDFSTGTHQVFRWVEIGKTRYETFTYGRRLTQRSQKNIPVHGIALADKLALHPDPLRILVPEEAAALAAHQTLPPSHICSVCNQPARAIAADQGGNVAYFCTSAHATLANESLIQSESGPVSAGPAFGPGSGGDWTHGSKTLLYMRVNFPDDLTEPVSETSVYNSMDDVNAFYVENSFEQTAVTTTTTPLLTLPQTKTWYSTAGAFSLLDDARKTARLAGFDTANYDLDIVAHTSVPGFSWGGLGFVGAKGTWLQSYSAGVAAHELGHNYGIGHANYWNTVTNNYGIGSGPGVSVEYGNIFDTMGNAAAGATHFGAAFKSELNWLPDSAIHTITSNGTYRIFPFDTPLRINGQQYAARVRKDYALDYWVDFRQKFTGNNWLLNGVMLNWGAQNNLYDVELIDPTPGTPTASGGREDAAVVIGRTFSDYAAGLHITPLVRGLTGSNAWLDVQINQGAFSANLPPTLQLEMDPPNPTNGTLIHFRANAQDPEGDALAYAWNFENLNFDTNNLPWSYRSYGTSGDRVVRCVVSDMKGGVASANVLVSIGTNTGFRISGRITDTSGQPIEGVRVDNGSNTLAQYRGGYTDSDGRFIIAGAAGSIRLTAIKYGYASGTPIGWANPLNVTNHITYANFTATPRPAISIVATNTFTPETTSATQYITLTRSGPVTNALTIRLFIAGTARIVTDYTLAPTLTNGSNNITFAIGTNQLVYAFRPVADTLSEGPETATFTIMDNSLNYVVTSKAEAAITILDDDQPIKPAVSIASGQSFILENGSDSCAHTVTRTGDTSGDLSVYYSISGTATAGTDFVPPPGVIIIPAGSASTTLAFPPLDDKFVEPEETVIVTLTANAAYTVSGSSARVSIMDDDQLTVTVVPVNSTLSEPATSGRFTVKREGDLTANLVVRYEMAGTATSGTDYTPPAGSVTLSAGAASADVIITPLNDALVEGEETVILTLVTNLGYDIGTPGNATLNLRDDELPSISLSAPDPDAAEPSFDTGMIRVSRGTVTNGTLTVFLAVSGTAIPGVDYIPLENFVIIPQGASSVDVEIIPFDDLHQEPNETIQVNLVAHSAYNIGGTRQTTVSLADDDGGAPPAAGFTFATSGAPESQSPGVSVSLTLTSTVPINVEYRVIGGTAGSNDYTLANGTLTFNPGDLVLSIPLQINNDTVAEGNRTVRLALFNPENATLDGNKIHTYTIQDDDVTSISISATTPTATEAGPTPGNFRISRTGDTNSALTVNFQVTGSASAPTDYAALGNSVTLSAGVTFVDLPVVPVPDQKVELNQTVSLTLISAPGSSLVAPNTATVTITDNNQETLPTITMVSTNHPHAVEGGGNGEFTFYRDQTNGSLTVSFSLAGNATDTADFQSLGTNVTFADGQSVLTLPVTPVDDSAIEGEETVLLILIDNSTYHAAFPSSAAVILQDNDQRVRLDASDFIAAEPGINQGEFTFTRFGTTNTDVQVFYTISGTASNGLDYVQITNYCTIPAGKLSATLPIVPLFDNLVEGPETVILMLAADPAYTLDSASLSGTVIINDDEPMVSVTAINSNVTEGITIPGVFRVSRTGNPQYSFTARLDVQGTASNGIDYVSFPTNVFFSCGIMSIDLDVQAIQDLVVEPRETVIVSLLSDPAYTIMSPSNATVNIIDAGTNQAPSVTITTPSFPFVSLQGTNLNMIIEATVVNDGPTNRFRWARVQGPTNGCRFDTTNLATTGVYFTNNGIYVIRVTVDDNTLTNYAEVTVAINAPSPGTNSNSSLYWNLDEGLGTNVFDLSGSNYNGVLEGSASWTNSGIRIGALSLQGSNDCVRATNATGLLNGLSALSLSLWVKSAFDGDQAIFCADDAGTNETLAIYRRATSSCSLVSNVLEFVIPTTGGTIHYTTVGDVQVTNWTHLAMTWASGQAPEVYINGLRDQPSARMQAFNGVLTNCPQFILGKGPSNNLSSWIGSVDEVELFSRVLSSNQIALMSSGAVGGVVTNGGRIAWMTNQAPMVEAGSNVTVQLYLPITITGSVLDDGLPNPPAALSNGWSKFSGASPITFTNSSSLSNTLTFTLTGRHVLRLISYDSWIKMFDEVTITVIEPTHVEITATDNEAAELGPDPGEFTFTRVGTTNVDLTLFLNISGTASNATDFTSISNTITFPAGQSTLTLPIIPYLDHRIEGDETLTLSILSNLSYTVDTAIATITIHDSPYGVWSVQRFTLEELTDPTLSGEDADFDNDGIPNFVEYCLNLNPRVKETNAPVIFTVETNAVDGLTHLTMNYHRRLLPTDASNSVIYANNILDWKFGTNYIRELSITDDGNNLTETVKAQAIQPLTISTNHFMTLRLWLPATKP